MQTIRKTHANYFSKTELSKSAKEEMSTLQEQYAIAMSLEPSVEEITASTEGESNVLNNAIKLVKLTQEKYLTSLNNVYLKEEELEKAKEKYALALSLEPTNEEINNLPSEVSKGTVLETILMQLRVLKLEYCKKKNKIKKTTIKQLTKGLAEAEAKEDNDKVEKTRNQIKKFEDDFLQQEWDKRKNFTFLEDERPTKNFLNIESKKMGYNEINKLKIKQKNSKEKKEISSQEEIRKETQKFFQTIYNKQDDVTPSTEEIKDFLKMDDDNSPWETLRNRRLPKELADSLEGDLTMKELHEALFFHMNGNSSPGSNGFTVAYLRAFWTHLKYPTLDALNDIQHKGLTKETKIL